MDPEESKVEDIELPGEPMEEPEDEVKDPERGQIPTALVKLKEATNSAEELADLVLRNLHPVLRPQEKRPETPPNHTDKDRPARVCKLATSIRLRTASAIRTRNLLSDIVDRLEL